MPNRDLKVTLVGDDKTSSAFKSASSNADGFGSKIASVGKGMALAFGGAVVGGVVGLGAAMVQGARDAASYQKITDQVAQTIKSTGGAAGVTVDGLKTYAGQIESMSGVDEELVLQGQNVLLTFTNIRNEAGKGNDIFNQTSLAASNMAATMGTDLVSANTLVGKALNDPIKGLTALQRVGVSFTDQQKEQITTMVNSGNTMGAQKVILAELSKEFGGAAQAAGQGLSGSIARAKDAFSDFFRNIATAVLPKLATFVEFIANNVGPALQGLFDLLTGGDFTGAFVGLGIPQSVVNSIEDVQYFIVTQLIPGVESLAKAALPYLKTAFDMLVSTISTVISVVGSVIGFFSRHETAAKALGVAVAAVAAVVGAAWVAQGTVATINAAKSVIAWFTTATASTTAATLQSRSTAQIVVGWLANAAAAVANAAVVVGGWVMMGVQSLIQAARMAAAWVIAMGPVGWVIAAVVGLVALIVANWDTVVSWTTTAWHAVTGAISAAWDWIVNAVRSALDFVVNLFLNFTGPGLIIKHWQQIVDFTRSLWNNVVSAVSGAWNAVTGAISNGVSNAVSFVASLPGRIMGAIGNLGSLLVNAGRNLLEGLWNGIQAAGSWLLSKVGSFFGNLLPGWVRSMLGIKSPSTVFAEMGRYLMLGMAGGIDDEAGSAVSAATRAANAISGAMSMQANAQGMSALALTRPLGMASGGSSPMLGGVTSPATSSPVVQIQNYNEARQPVHEVAQELAFIGRTR